MQPSWGYYVNEAKVLTAQNARTYGRWLGARYKAAPNVMWMMGGDRPALGYEHVWRELAAGLREGDGGVHLVTYHPCYGRSSADFFHQDGTLSFNLIQTWAEWTSVHPAVLSETLRTPPKPVVHGEGAYENGPEYPTGPITPLVARRQAWWAVMAGGFHTYGQNQMWRMEEGWEDTFDTPGATQVPRVKQILTSRNWWDLVPDQSLFASGVSSEKTLNAAMRSASGDYAIVYLASPSQVVLHLDKIASRRVKVTWVSPVTGECRGAGTYETGNVPGKVSCDLRPQAFSTPRTWEDAVLLLEAVSE
jgi:hypothetical protein